jgi:hypothetical protein
VRATRLARPLLDVRRRGLADTPRLPLKRFFLENKKSKYCENAKNRGGQNLTQNEGWASHFRPTCP